MIIVVEKQTSDGFTPALLNIDLVGFADRRAENLWAVRVDGMSFLVRVDEVALDAAINDAQGGLPDFRVKS